MRTMSELLAVANRRPTTLETRAVWPGAMWIADIATTAVVPLTFAGSSSSGAAIWTGEVNLFPASPPGAGKWVVITTATVTIEENFWGTGRLAVPGIGVRTGDPDFFETDAEDPHPQPPPEAVTSVGVAGALVSEDLSGVGLLGVTVSWETATSGIGSPPDTVVTLRGLSMYAIPV